MADTETMSEDPDQPAAPTPPLAPSTPPPQAPTTLPPQPQVVDQGDKKDQTENTENGVSTKGVEMTDPKENTDPRTLDEDHVWNTESTGNTDPRTRDEEPRLNTESTLTTDLGTQDEDCGLNTDTTKNTDPGSQDEDLGLNTDLAENTDPGSQNENLGLHTVSTGNEDPGTQEEDLAGLMEATLSAFSEVELEDSDITGPDLGVAMAPTEDPGVNMDPGVNDDDDLDRSQARLPPLANTWENTDPGVHDDDDNFGFYRCSGHQVDDTIEEDLQIEMDMPRSPSFTVPETIHEDEELILGFGRDNITMATGQAELREEDEFAKPYDDRNLYDKMSDENMNSDKSRETLTSKSKGSRNKSGSASEGRSHVLRSGAGQAHSEGGTTPGGVTSSGVVMRVKTKGGGSQDVKNPALSHEEARLQAGRPRSPFEAMGDGEENVVMMTLYSVTEEGDLEGLQALLEKTQDLDINHTNKHGETALHLAASGGHVDIIKHLQLKGANLDARDKHGDSAVFWAARQGQMEVVKYLKEEGISINTQNKAGEAAIHVAARYGHVDCVEYLCFAGADVKLQDQQGETPLHHAAWHGLPARSCAMICTAGALLASQNQEGETPFHCAAARGNIDCVKVLLSQGSTLDVEDKRGSTPLHLAVRRGHIAIALMLVHAGCQIDALDHSQETPLHPACHQGLLPVVQTLCAFGCQVDILSKGGASPLHLSSRAGHIEVVRCLLLSGADPELPNKDGITSEIMALAQGHQETAELLSRLKPDRREAFIKQLIPRNQPLHRIKVKVFGNTGVGKTTMLDSLKCGYFGSFFRKARLTTSNSMTNGKQKSVETNGSTTRHRSLPTQMSYDVSHEGYTHGIDVQQASISGAGELSLWEFSGYEPYYMLYDHFIGDPNCIHIVVFKLSDPQDVQLTQVLFWLNFIKVRVAPMEPVGHCGRHPWPPRVLLVATHADKVKCTKNSRGDLDNADSDLLLSTVKQKFDADMDIADHVFVMDSHLAMSNDLKSLRSYLGEAKDIIVNSLPSSNGFLDAVVACLANWRKAIGSFPVVTWPTFVDFIRKKSNLLASEEHLKELMCQLQLCGEVVYVETDGEDDLVVLCPRWLCSDILGSLFSNEFLSHSRPTGIFSEDDIHLMFPESDAKDLLELLEALDVCVRCEAEGDVEYEFPALNFVETLHGLWDRDITQLPNPVYGGVRVHPARGCPTQLMHLFPRIQTQLRKDILHQAETNPDCDLYQWYHGSKFCSGSLEALVTLEQGDSVVEIKCRGPEETSSTLFHFHEDICEIVLEVLEDSCPGMFLEKHLLSASDLKVHKKSVKSYAPKDVLVTQLAGRTTIQHDEDSPEELIDLVCFGSEEIYRALTRGVDLHVSHLSIMGRRALAAILDPVDPMGRDWCLLAVALGLTETLPAVDQQNAKLAVSKTDNILELWSQDPRANIATLISKLEGLNRQDAVDAIYNVVPLFLVVPEGRERKGGLSQPPPSASSDNTLSSVSR